LCDRQTIGGYPKLGSVFSQDIARLAQMMPGKKLRFKPLSIDQAQRLLQETAS
jgi:allophanate hydrolase subunit 2